MPMRNLILPLVLLAACGLETTFSNATHDQYDRPASKIVGAVPWEGAKLDQIVVTDGDGNPLTPFLQSLTKGSYELRLPSSKYTMLVAHLHAGNLDLRSLIAGVGEEAVAKAVDFDELNMTETLIVEARLSHDKTKLSTLSPEAYLGTRKLIRAAFNRPGPTQDLFNMVKRFTAKYDKFAVSAKGTFFAPPVLDGDWSVSTSPIDDAWMVRNPFDYVGDGKVRAHSDDFDAKLGEVAKLYTPAGCPDPAHVRLVFTVNMNDGQKNGNCGSIDRFRWAVDKPGKQMFFVGWIHKESELQDPATNNLLGGSAPNNVKMYDDGTNGDEVAGDNIWTVTFNVPTDPNRKLRIGFKYTWGTSGAVWTGSEEWPGNSRILEVVDDSGDHVVYRRDYFGDEATNKDNSNLNLTGNGSIDWKTDLHGCGVPEAHESKYDNSTCKCASDYFKPPKSVGPINVACTN